MGSAQPQTVESVQIPLADVTLLGDLVIPPQPIGLVLFAHGSGSSRKSSRNRQVAKTLQEAQIATLLMDLLSEEEEVAERWTAQLRFDIALLAERLAGATRWATQQEQLKKLAVGYFGASTGAAAALMASIRRPGEIRVIVSRGGRPDLAGPALREVTAPTLLIVGGADYPVIELNQEAFGRLKVEKQLDVIPHATHLFEEPGALEQVAALARDWFTHYLRRNAT
jgi:pimeloyl-ACP methyl ester carboxylesterase